MGEKKGQHIFYPGDLVLPHPIIAYMYGDVHDGEYGIVLKNIAPSHPSKDFRKVVIFWQEQMREETYYSHLLFHLHHEEQLKQIWEQWYEVFNNLKQRQIGASNMAAFSILQLDHKKYPHYNPCKGLKS